MSTTVVPTVPQDLFDLRPIRLEGGIVFRSRRVDFVGRPSLAQWMNAFDLATASEESSPFWVGDLWNYAEDKPEWRDRLQQALAERGRDLQFKTFTNLGSISRKVSGDKARLLAPSVSHAGMVQRLDPDEQVEWLEKARVENMPARDLRLAIRGAARRRVIEGQATLIGQYRILYGDPSWLYDDRQPSASSTADFYPGMTIDEMCKLPVAAHTMKDAVLFMWITAPLALKNPGPREVGEAWGFTYKQQIIWDKVNGAGGNYTRGNHEILTIWTRGSCTPDIQEDLPDSVQTVRREHDDEHSAKPEEFRRLIEKHWTFGPKVELFAREPHEGWDAFGNDARLWAGDVSRVGG